MAGGLLNLISIGNANLFLTGNPSKTFFRTSYVKHTNFGLQKFRIDYKGTKDLRLTEPSTFTFKMPRHADLLMDTYLVMSLPDIWSPIHPPTEDTGERWAPYNFRWIEDLGAQMIQEIEIRCGSFVLSRYSGEYLSAVVERDFEEMKKKNFRHMSGNVVELNNPALAYGRENTYPNAHFIEGQTTTAGVEPSIRGREIYVPINAWFTMDSKCALPMIALQYNELEISVTIRPIQDLFQVRDVHEEEYEFPYVRPDFNQNRFQMYRFLQSPKNEDILHPNAYDNKVGVWNADIHMLSTYCFLEKSEARQFAQEDQMYLVKDVFVHKYDNIHGSKKVKLETTGMVSSWMWYFQRNDVNMRNEWSNYTNWPYYHVPSDITIAPHYIVNYRQPNGKIVNSGLYISGNYAQENRKHIMENMAIVLDGKYRENSLPRGIFDYVEKYARTNGFAKEGLYCYNFCLDSNSRVYQPSGAINLGKFKNIELEFNTFIPKIDEVNNNFEVLCDEDGTPAAVKKTTWKLYEYSYNLVLFEERYNIISFIGGNCGMMYAR